MKKTSLGISQEGFGGAGLGFRGLGLGVQSLVMRGLEFGG